MVMLGKIVRLSVTWKNNWVVTKNCIQKAMQLNPRTTSQPQVTSYQATDDIITYKKKKNGKNFFPLWLTAGEKKKMSTGLNKRGQNSTIKQEARKALVCDEQLDDEVLKTDEGAEHGILLRGRLRSTYNGFAVKNTHKRVW